MCNQVFVGRWNSAKSRMTGWKKHWQDELWVQRIFLTASDPNAWGGFSWDWWNKWRGRGDEMVHCSGGDEVERISCWELKRQKGLWTSCFFWNVFYPLRVTGCCGTIIKLLRGEPHRSVHVSAERRRSLTCEVTTIWKPRPFCFHFSGHTLAVPSLLSFFISLSASLLLRSYCNPLQSVYACQPRFVGGGSKTIKQ